MKYKDVKQFINKKVILSTDDRKGWQGVLSKIGNVWFVLSSVENPKNISYLKARIADIIEIKEIVWGKPIL